MWSSAFFFPCPGFLGPVPSRVEGKSDGGSSAFSRAEGSSVYVPGVTAGAKAICWGAARDSNGSVHVSRIPFQRFSQGPRAGKYGKKIPLTIYVLLFLL